MTSSATPRARPAGMPRSTGEGRELSLRLRWPWVVLTGALLVLLALAWSATRWYPATCASPGCEAEAPARILVHWAGIAGLSVVMVIAAGAAVRDRAGTTRDLRARLSPTWHGVVVGFVVMVLATGALIPTVGLGLFSPPLGVGLIITEWVLLTLVLDRMHLAARPASSPRRRLGQSFLVAAGVIGFEVALPLFSPAAALSAGMLQLALLQAGVALVLTTWFSLRDPAPHGDQPSEQRIALVGVVSAVLVVVVLAVVGLNLNEATFSGFGADLRSLLQPYR